MGVRPGSGAATEPTCPRGNRSVHTPTLSPSTFSPLVRRATAPGEAGTVEAGAALLSTGVQKFDDVFSHAYAATAVRDSRASTRLRRRLRSRRVNFHWNGVAASW